MRDLIEAAVDAKIILGPDLTVLDLNEKHAAMTGVARDDAVGHHVLDVFPQDPTATELDTAETLMASFSRAAEQGEDVLPIHRHDLKREDGSYQERYWQLTHTPLQSDGQTVAFLQTARDVTSAVLSDRLHGVRQRAAEAVAKLSFIDYDPATGVFLRAPEIDALFGFAPDEAGPYAKPFFDRMPSEDRAGVEAEIERVLAAETGMVGHFDYAIIRPDGSKRWAVAKVEAMRPAGAGSAHLVGSIMDVTHLHETEKRLRQEVEAREVLLAELNHRVKNSMQMVQSVLALEVHSGAEGSKQEVLSRVLGRVRAIATVHSQLYHRDGAQTVDLGSYLPDLARTVGAENKVKVKVKVKVEVEGPSCHASADNAIPIALIVNDILACLVQSEPTLLIVAVVQGSDSAFEVRFGTGGTASAANALQKVNAARDGLLGILIRQVRGDWKVEGNDGSTRGILRLAL